MVSIKSEIASQIERVRDAVASFQPVTIVAVTKFQPVEKIQDALDCGLLNLGINHAQQGDDLKKALKDTQGLKLHFIGHIQSRKAKSLTDYHLVQSLDRLLIVEEWKKHIPLKQSIEVLIEVNVGGEEQKSGILPGDLEEFIGKLKGHSFVRLRGLMAMPPFLEPPELRAPYFNKMRRLFERFRDDTFNVLSMGTSSDYRIALSEGSNMIRLGTTIFGKRM